MRKTLFVFAAFFLIGLGLIAVAFQHSTYGPADFTYVSSAEPKSLDPAIMTGQLEGRPGLAMFEGLTYWDPKTIYNVPGMAERWEVSDDERVWTFHIRRNARWSNGDLVTARDFHWSWMRALHPDTASEYYYMLGDIVGAEEFHKGEIRDFSKVGVKVLDDYTLQVTLKYPVPYFLDLTSFYTLCPVHRPTVEKWQADPDAPPGAWAQPGRIVVNGPFTLDFWIVNDRIRLRKNPLYWNADSIRVETIDALSIEDSTAALNAFLVGTADWNPSKWPAAVGDKLRELPELIRTEAFFTYYYRFNTTRPHLKDPRVRRAISM
ncbi:MAG: peptide ABC transporter substrate-binding protein, partial [Planctomycetota bacterium]